MFLFEILNRKEAKSKEIIKIDQNTGELAIGNDEELDREVFNFIEIYVNIYQLNWIRFFVLFTFVCPQMFR